MQSIKRTIAECRIRMRFLLQGGQVRCPLHERRDITNFDISTCWNAYNMIKTTCNMCSPEAPSSAIEYINEDQVVKLLSWDKVFEAVEASMRAVSAVGKAVQEARTFTHIPSTGNFLLTMPGYLQDANFGSLACKLVTVAHGNEKRDPPLANILAHIALFNEETGELKALMAGTEITSWRTAAASLVATQHIRDAAKKKQYRICAILGAGAQGKIHAAAFYERFKFGEVRIWNRTETKACKLVQELNAATTSHYGDNVFKLATSVEECCKDADVIVTTTAAPGPILKLEWVKKGAHINAVGAERGSHFSEVDAAIYKSADVYIDHWVGARAELTGLQQIGVAFKGEIGEIISGKSGLVSTDLERITVFQSLGMAVEDCAVARLVYDQLLESRKPKDTN